MTSNLEAIKVASGVDFSVEIDFAGIKAVLAADNSYGDRLGEALYDWYMGALAGNVKRFCQAPLQKEALVEHLGEKKTIRFVVTKAKLADTYAYAQTADDGGVLVCTIPVDKFCSNVDNLGNDLNKALAGSGPLSLNQRKNIADHNEKLQSNLATIKTSTGIDFDVEIDWADIAKQMAQSDYKERLGEAFYDWYLTALSNSLKKLCSDELGKEAFVDKAGAKKLIRFQIVEKAKDDYVYSVSEFLSDGTLVISIPKKKMCSNVDNTGNDIEKLL
jgi:hypothetical protein